MSYVSHSKDASGRVTEVVVDADLKPAEGKKPPKVGALACMLFAI